MNKIASNTIWIKRLNVQLVKDALIKLNYGTKLTISRETGLSIATCGNILNELLDQGEVIEVDMEQPNGGRPARRFIYNANYYYVACIYMSYERGIYHLTHAVVNLIGEKLEEDSVTLDNIGYEDIDCLIGKLISKYDVKAIGIGIPGVVHNSIVVGECDIRSLINFPLEQKLKEKYSIKIIIENDMNLKTLGFYNSLNYDEDKNIAVINFPRGNCIGSGIIVDGSVIKGNTNFAGEVSYLPLFDSQQELMQQLESEDGFIPVAAKVITSVITIINPDTIALTGDIVKSNMCDDIIKKCSEIIPKEHMPNIMIRENIQDDYMNGLVSVTIESMTCHLHLVKKKYFSD